MFSSRPSGRGVYPLVAFGGVESMYIQSCSETTDIVLCQAAVAGPDRGKWMEETDILAAIPAGLHGLGKIIEFGKDWTRAPEDWQLNDTV